MTGPSPQDVHNALARLGHYRVTRAQEFAAEGPSDGISGALLLALGLRETWGRNIEGGAKEVEGKWVKLDANDPYDARRMDVGWLQINRYYHHDALGRMPAVRSGTWGPVVEGASPMHPGFVPRFEEAMRYTRDELRESIAFALDHSVPKDQAARFAVAAHNAGQGGALAGFRQADVDANTAGGNYSAWVLAARAQVNRWLAGHPHWTWEAE